MPGDLKVFGAELRRWRQQRRYSQEQLAERSSVSQRHLSFLENGRTRPSPEMVEHLAITLDVPLRARNGLLTSAGFAPVYSDESLDGDALAGIRRSLEALVRAHEPFPAFVLDKAWNVQLANDAAARITGLLLDPTRPTTLGTNILQLMLHPDGVRDAVVNWESTATVLVNRLRAECDQNPFDDDLRQLLEQVLAYPGVTEALASGSSYASTSDLITSVHLRIDGADLRFFTTIMILSDAADVTVSELRLETLLPADVATEAMLRQGRD